MTRLIYNENSNIFYVTSLTTSITELDLKMFECNFEVSYSVSLTMTCTFLASFIQDVFLSFQFSYCAYCGEV